MAKEISPIAKAVRSARFLVEALSDLEHYSEVYSLSNGTPLPSLGEDDYNAVTDAIAFAGVDLRDGLVDLTEELDAPGVWTALSEANIAVATVADCHDQCFCGAVRQAAFRRYGQLLHMSSEGEWREWLRLGPHPSTFPKIEYQRVIDNIDDVIRVMASGSHITRQFLQQALIKEMSRAGGVVPPQGDGFAYPNDARDKWIYEEKRSGRTHSQIKFDLGNYPDWDQLDSEQSVGQAAARYAARNNLPLLRRKRQ